MSYPRKYTGKKGVVWYWRFKAPERNSKTGEIEWKWRERRTKARTQTECKALGPEIEREFHLDQQMPEPEPDEKTFHEVAYYYVKSGGDSRFLGQILAYINQKTVVSKITQEFVQTMADSLYPGCAPSTINRQVFTPVNAVLRYGSKVRPKMCDEPSLIRPRGHTSNAIPELPTDDWFKAVLPHLSVKKRAVLLFVRLHGVRISEALERKPSDLDTRTWTLTIPASKKGNPPRYIELSPPVIEAIQDIPEWHNQKWLFGTRSRSNVRRDLLKACAKAGVPYYSTHPAGRHSFATGYLNDGKSLKELQEAGGWQSLKMPGRYAHLEKSAVQKSVSDSANRWYSSLQESA